MCKIWPLILNFLREFLAVKGHEKDFLSAFRSQFVSIGPTKILKIGQGITFSWQNIILNRDFALAREIIHDHKFPMYAIYMT